MFADRTAAGIALAAELKRLMLSDGLEGDVAVLALPRGGVPVGAEVARALGAPLGLVMVRKLGVPWQPELAAGAVVDGPQPVIVRNEGIIAQTGLSDRDLEETARHELQEIKRRRARYAGPWDKIDVAGRIAIVVDDGIATGATALAALRALSESKPKALMLAVPVGPPIGLSEIEEATDRLVILERPDHFFAIGVHYRDFSQVSDAQVRAALEDANVPGEEEPGAGSATRS